MADFGATAAIWGCFHGLLAQAKLTPGIIAGTVSEDEKWWHKVLRLLVAGLCALPWTILGGLLTGKGYNVYVALVFASTIPTLAIGFSLFFFADWVNMKIGLLKLTPSREDKNLA